MACADDHLGAYGFPSRPAEPYPFRPECGDSMVWACAACDEPMPADAAEHEHARFCRACGEPCARDAEAGGTVAAV